MFMQLLNSSAKIVIHVSYIRAYLIICLSMTFPQKLQNENYKHIYYLKE